jgi:hypothetical protein
MVLLTASTPPWNSGTDDSGAGTDGSVHDAAFLNVLKQAIEYQLHSSTNPTVLPKTTTDEVVAARGSKASLMARLDISTNPDGTAKTDATLLPITSFQNSQFASKNLVADSLMLNWANGSTVAPYGFTLGGGGSVVRCGVGPSGFTEASAPADTTRADDGPWSAKLTYATSLTTLTKTIINTTQFARMKLAGKKVGFGAWINAAAANEARVAVNDGVIVTGSYHTGDGTWQWITGVAELDPSATSLSLVLSAASGTPYFGPQVVCISDYAPAMWFPARVGYLTIGLQQRGTLVAGTTLNGAVYKIPRFGGILIDIHGALITDPAAGSATWDVNKRTTATGADTTCLSATKLAIGTGAHQADLLPNGTYAARCFTASDFVTVDCDNAGATTPGADATIELVFAVPMPELDILGMGTV